MSENNRTSNNDINSENKTASDGELEELISTVMAIKKKQRRNDLNQTRKNTGAGKPNDSLKKAAACSAPINESRAHSSSSVSSEHSLAKKKKPDADRKKRSSRKGFRSWSAKKKTGVILGFVFLLLCILALIVWGVFEGYVSLLNRDNGGINTDKPVYSDVDPTKADTIDEQTEEENLKSQLEKSASALMSDSDVYNILLIGEDIRDTEQKSRGNTDVMMLISINSKLETITMTSFMRDIYLYLPDAGYSNRLNAAYHHGGAQSLENTLEQYFGVTIDRYVVVNFYSFIDIVDTVGGLNLTVSDAEAIGMQEPMAEQNKYLNNEKGTDYLYEGGEDLLLNGNQSLAYARLRYVGNADFERTERQRKVIAEMINKSKKLSLVKLDKLLNSVLPDVTTDLESGEIASLLLNAFDYMNYDIQELRIPADGTFTNEYINGMSVLSIDFDSNMQLLQQTVYGDSAVAASADPDEDENGYDQYGNNNGSENGYYDAYGNWVSQNSGYYDEYGNWISY
ncbi:LCP family protein [Ruminococcus sp. Marseille-P6503]|uniref:LCP family protein n=1 Tax=Ruminococcus sp. Marseille-P6503 TaxID=2364796 RepID=UPI0013DDC445|nr:LCP family protein [Ruminococcus sp. Marseille-P6503]